MSSFSFRPFPLVLSLSTQVKRGDFSKLNIPSCLISAQEVDHITIQMRKDVVVAVIDRKSQAILLCNSVTVHIN